MITAAPDLVHDDEFECILFPLTEQVDASEMVEVDCDDRDLRTGAPRWSRVSPDRGEVHQQVVLVRHREGDQGSTRAHLDGREGVGHVVERIGHLADVTRSSDVERFGLELTRCGPVACARGGRPVVDPDPDRVGLALLKLAGPEVSDVGGRAIGDGAGVGETDVGNDHHRLRESRLGQARQLPPSKTKQPTRPHGPTTPAPPLRHRRPPDCRGRHRER